VAHRARVEFRICVFHSDAMSCPWHVGVCCKGEVEGVERRMRLEVCRWCSMFLGQTLDSRIVNGDAGIRCHSCDAVHSLLEVEQTTSIELYIVWTPSLIAPAPM
jgi:hypothetical protein